MRITLSASTTAVSAVLAAHLPLAAAAAGSQAAEAELDAFRGAPALDRRNLFIGDRFANVLVTTEGTVLAFYGRSEMRLRRSGDGGATWESAESPSIPGLFNGNVMVDETNGDVLFVSLETGEDRLWRRGDEGRNWAREPTTLVPNEVVKWLERTGLSERVGREGRRKRTEGYWMRTSHGESGITLRHGQYAGRLLMYAAFRPHADAHPSDRDPRDAIYACAIYTDDGGRTGRVSGFFPEGYTEEAAIEELHDGRLYSNARSHKG